MNPEPLIDKEHYRSTGYDYEKYFLGKDIKSAVDFYKKYENNMNKLFKDKMDLYVKYTNEWHKIKVTIFPNKLENHLIFNHWLFNHCFGDVIDV